MSRAERALYGSYFGYVLNQILLPLKLLVPQPIISKVPILTTNHEIWIGMALQAVRGRVLDIGCGENYLMRRYREAGGWGIGIDVYPWAHVDQVVEDTAKLPFADATFDTITFVACLNHIPNRAEVLVEARRLLAPRGRILVTNLTPGLSRVWHGWAYWDADQHQRGMKEGEVFGFKEPELIKLTGRAGFYLIERQPFSWGLNCLYIFQAKT